MDTLEKLKNNGIIVNYAEIAKLCKKYSVMELSIFGSSIRNDFTAKSDIDILVSFAEDAQISLFDIMDLENEFAQLLGRDVEILEVKAIKNPIRRESILSTREIIYAD